MYQPVMKFRITLFIVFQILAWTAYFNWDSNNLNTSDENIAERVLQVEEMSVNKLASMEVRKELYNLVLRNDGFFTKINSDQSVENGLWIVNRSVPSLVLRSPKGDKKYRIIEDSKGFIQLELLNTSDLIQTAKSENTERTLYSSIN